MIPPVFLSASEPNPQRRPEYWDSRKLLNVREAVRAFCAHALTYYPVVFGGHPAITPLVRNVADRIAHDSRLENEGRDGLKPRLLTYQSRLFVDRKNSDEEIITEPLDRDGNDTERPKTGWRNESLLYMRYQMIGTPRLDRLDAMLEDAPSHWMRRYGGTLGAARKEKLGTDKFSAAVFIGGMEGVVREYRIFRSFHPDTPAFPIGSTGSACAEELLPLIKDHLPEGRVEELRTMTAYTLLMQKILPPPPPPHILALAPRALAEAVGWREGEETRFRITDHSDPPEINRKFPPNP